MRRRHAFTLVELLVVIAIIALLVSILLPALQRRREQAQLLKCMSGTRQVFFAVEMYCNDFKGYYPTIPGASAATRGNPPPYWHQMLIDRHYMAESVQTNRGGCPDGPNPRTPSVAIPYTCWPYDSTGGDYYTVPSDPNSVSYCLNGILQSGFSYRSPPPDGVNYYGYWSVWKRTSGAIRHNATTVGVVFCSSAPGIWNSQSIYPALWADLAIQPNAYQMTLTTPYRHKGKWVPVACADGHVETMPREELLAAVINVPTRTTINYYSTMLLYFSIP